MSTYKKIAEEIKQIYEAKNHDYNNSFDKSLDTFGSIAGIIRIGDKYNRLEQLTKSEEEPKVKESIADTLKDLANYCIMTAAWLER